MKLKIVHLISSLSGGGAERQLSYLCPELARIGYEIHVAYLNPGPDSPKLPGVITEKLDSLSNYSPSILWQIIRLIRNVRPDVIQTWAVQMDILGGLAASVSRIPVIVRDPVCLPSEDRRRWKERIRLKVARGAKAIIITNSESGSYYWREKAPDLDRHIVQNAVPVGIINRGEESVPEDIKGLKGKKILLFAGRLADKQKNITNLLQAIKIASRKESFQAIFCGDGPDRNLVLSLIRKLNLEDRLHLKGYVKEIWGYMKASDVFVSVSHYEGRPNSVLEAMACQCPLIVSDIREHREFLDESMALFVDPRAPAKISSAIINSLNCPEDSRNRAIRARGHVESYSLDRIAQNYGRIYERVKRGTWENESYIPEITSNGIH